MIQPNILSLICHVPGNENSEKMISFHFTFTIIFEVDYMKRPIDNKRVHVEWWH
jgi:hypothetical protein